MPTALSNGFPGMQKPSLFFVKKMFWLCMCVCKSVCLSVPESHKWDSPPLPPRPPEAAWAYQTALGSDEVFVEKLFALLLLYAGIKSLHHSSVQNLH